MAHVTVALVVLMTGDASTVKLAVAVTRLQPPPTVQVADTNTDPAVVVETGNTVPVCPVDHVMAPLQPVAVRATGVLWQISGAGPLMDRAAGGVTVTVTVIEFVHRLIFVQETAKLFVPVIDVGNEIIFPDNVGT